MSSTETGKVREVDTKEYIDMLMELVREGKCVNLTIAGGSMSPFLVNQRDLVCLEPMKREPGKGDIVLFQRPGGEYILHRICRVGADGYYIVGDAQVEVEGPVAREQICCIIEKACRKGTWINRTDFWWKFFAGVWLHVIPFRRGLIRLYGLVNRKGHRESGL